MKSVWGLISTTILPQQNDSTISRYGTSTERWLHTWEINLKRPKASTELNWNIWVGSNKHKRSNSLSEEPKFLWTVKSWYLKDEDGQRWYMFLLCKCDQLYPFSNDDTNLKLTCYKDDFKGDNYISERGDNNINMGWHITMCCVKL